MCLQERFINKPPPVKAALSCRSYLRHSTIVSLNLSSARAHQQPVRVRLFSAQSDVTFHTLPLLQRYQADWMRKAECYVEYLVNFFVSFFFKDEESKNATVSTECAYHAERSSPRSPRAFCSGVFSPKLRVVVVSFGSR